MQFVRFLDVVSVGATSMPEDIVTFSLACLSVILFVLLVRGRI